MFDTFYSICRLSLKAIAANKMRAALTSLGIVIGVAAVITMLAVGSGTQKSMAERFSRFGTNILYLRQPWDLDSSITSPKDITIKDVEAIRKVPGVASAAPYINSGFDVKYGYTSTSVGILATDTDIFKTYDWQLDAGRHFTQKEVSSYAQVIVLGASTATTIFNDVDPVGRTVVLSEIPFKVVGVMKKNGQGGMGFDMDEGALIPYTTGKVKMNTGWNSSNRHALDRVIIRVQDFNTIETTKKGIENAVRNTHHIHPLAKDDFQLDDFASFVEEAKGASKTMSLLLGVIGAVSLLVGGIGVMNIMLVSVTERTREIGIRMAIGATSADIRLQFLAEAVTLSCIGGLIGVILGVGITLFVSSHSSSIPAELSVWSIVLSVGFSAATGVFFGYYPAYKASKLTPIDALRYE
ncbi:MAG: ABC transporter permease [Spirochaetota bacterium]|uniref:ABC transporter permease n=1 Tax=Candidatus Avelusimicrobium faecicola TaxID=3416205 RepID=UPI002A5D55B3|nr:ABC transporter permease [Spirochaetota bacterium]MDY6129427.1 ABC transporter permease [Elusimicrobiaceae bacterium]